MITACALATAASIGVMLLIVGYVTVNGFSYFNIEFLTSEPVPLGQSGGGISHAITGSAMLVGVAVLLAVPLGIGAGVYLAEYASAAVGGPIRFVCDILTGVPSIVVGVFVYGAIVIYTGFSGLSGGVALAVIMLPIVARTTEEALRLVPQELREASLALGVPRWRTVTAVVLPAAATGVVTGSLLALARAAGETAPLIFTAFGNNFFRTDMTEPVAAMPLIIYRYAISPFSELQEQAWAAATILVGVVLLVNIGVRALARR